MQSSVPVHTDSLLALTIVLSGACADTAPDGELGQIRQAVVAQCGETWDSEGVEQLSGALPVTEEYVAAHERPVGQLQNPGYANCSGTLVDTDLFLTAAHCVPNRAIGDGAVVRFNYQEDSAGSPYSSVAYQVLDVLEYQTANPDLPWAQDYAILQLAGAPGDVWGITKVAEQGPDVADSLVMMGHPDGRPKEVATGEVVSIIGLYVNVNIDAESGSSGSGILDAASGELVGVYFRSGCEDPSIGYNGVLSMTNLLQLSPTLTALANEPEPEPEHGDLSFEDASAWSVQSGSISSEATVVSDGQASLAVNPQSYTTVQSPALDSRDLTASASRVSVDLYIGHNQPNPWWVGNFQFLVHSPSAGIYNRYVGQVELNATPRQQFVTHSFNLPNDVKTALAGEHADVQVRFALNVNAGSGPYYLDNARFLR